MFLKIGTPLGYNNPTYELMNLFNANPNDTRKDACFRVWKKSSTVSVPYISKYIDASMTQPLQGENDWIILRFSDIKLLYAEILAQDGNFANAHNPLNDVRDRAGLDGMGLLGQKKKLWFGLCRKALELAFENQRWFDLLRMAKSYDNRTKPMEILRKHTFETIGWAVFEIQSKCTTRQKILYKGKIVAPDSSS
jgi:hypothetical protein